MKRRHPIDDKASLRIRIERIIFVQWLCRDHLIIELGRRKVNLVSHWIRVQPRTPDEDIGSTVARSIFDFTNILRLKCSRLRLLQGLLPVADALNVCGLAVIDNGR